MKLVFYVKLHPLLQGDLYLSLAQLVGRQLGMSLPSSLYLFAAVFRREHKWEFREKLRLAGLKRQHAHS
jgi:hypothetical protein